MNAAPETPPINVHMQTPDGRLAVSAVEHERIVQVTVADPTTDKSFSLHVPTIAVERARVEDATGTREVTEVPLGDAASWQRLGYGALNLHPSMNNGAIHPYQSGFAGSGHPRTMPDIPLIVLRTNGPQSAALEIRTGNPDEIQIQTIVPLQPIGSQ
jgi:hypothetical protein